MKCRVVLAAICAAPLALGLAQAASAPDAGSPRSGPSGASDLSTPTSAWRAFQRALEREDEKALRLATPPKGLEAIAPELDLSKREGRAALKQRWGPWADSPIRWEPRSATQTVAFFADQKGGPRLVFVRVAKEWKLDDFWPGK